MERTQETLNINRFLMDILGWGQDRTLETKRFLWSSYVFLLKTLKYERVYCNLKRHLCWKCLHTPLQIIICMTIRAENWVWDELQLIHILTLWYELFKSTQRCTRSAAAGTARLDSVRNERAVDTGWSNIWSLEQLNTTALFPDIKHKDTQNAAVLKHALQWEKSSVKSGCVVCIISIISPLGCLKAIFSH